MSAYVPQVPNSGRRRTTTTTTKGEETLGRREKRKKHVEALLSGFDGGPILYIHIYIHIYIYIYTYIYIYILDFTQFGAQWVKVNGELALYQRQKWQWKHS